MKNKTNIFRSILNSRNGNSSPSFRRPSWQDVILAILSALVGAFSASCAVSF